MSALALSVLLCLVSAVAYAGGAILQEHVAASSPDRRYAPLRRAGWWAAVALNGLGALLHVVALAFGPLSLVQPLGALTIVFALPMAAVFVRRRAGAAAWRGALLATAGLAGLLALTGGEGAGRQALAGGERSLLLAVTAAGAALLVLAAGRMRRAVLRSVLLAAAAGTAFGMGSVFTKSVAEGFSPGTLGALWPDLVAIAVLGVRRAAAVAGGLSGGGADRAAGHRDRGQPGGRGGGRGLAVRRRFPVRDRRGGGGADERRPGGGRPDPAHGRAAARAGVRSLRFRRPCSGGTSGGRCRSRSRGRCASRSAGGGRWSCRSSRSGRCAGRRRPAGRP
ncbi:predicted protein [Streptomyces sp. C]|nr:predicted protein [Streptomyces sp. C]